MQAQLTDSKDSLIQFQEYCWSFYAPKAIYGKMFDNKLTRAEMNASCIIISQSDNFEGDSFDREKARDILFKVRGFKTEHYA